MRSSQLVTGCFLGTQRDTTLPNEKLWQRINDLEIEHSTPVEKKQVPDSKYPSQPVTKVLRDVPWIRRNRSKNRITNQITNTQELEETVLHQGASDQPRRVVGSVDPWGPTLTMKTRQGFDCSADGLQTVLTLYQGLTFPLRENQRAPRSSSRGRTSLA
jgi:hypothetical protein